MTTGRVPPAFVLVRPQMGENIGAAARAMWNFGLDRMRIVAPRDGWPNQRAVAMASGAGRLLDQAQLCKDIPDALSDCTHVYATTARPRGMVKPVMTPEEAVRDMLERTDRGEKIAILFGPERAGLENDDVALANTIITVPVNPDFASLNLGQCVLLVAYEWGRQSAAWHAAGSDHTPDLATHQEIEALARHYQDRLEDAGFFFPPEKADHMRRNLRNLWSRMPFTRGDVQILHGILRQLTRWKDRQN
jgi:tRNA/rRNA methyltransferase